MTQLDSNATDTQNIYFQSKVVKIFDYSYRGNYIAFLDPLNDKINVTNFKMSEESGILEKNGSIVINNNGKPKCLAIDWIHDLIYWIDIKSNTINVVNIMKPELTLLLIDLGEEEVTSLVINPLKVVLIWIKKGIYSKIMQSFQDGSNQMVLYSNSYRNPSHITIDFETEGYYFISQSGSALYSIDFRGNNEKVYLYGNFFGIVNDIISLNDDLFFPIDEALVRLREVSLKQKKLDLVLISSKFNDSENYFNSSLKSQKSFRQEIYGVKIVNPLIQPNFTNKCQSANCPYLCLPSGNVAGFRCICPTNSSSYINICEVYIPNLIVRTTTVRLTFRTLRTERLMTTYRTTLGTTYLPDMERTIDNDPRFRPELNTESLVKNPEGYNHMKGNEGNLNIQLMFGFIIIGFFVLSLIMTALIILNFRYGFDFLRHTLVIEKLSFEKLCFVSYFSLNIKSNFISALTLNYLNSCLNLLSY